MFKFLKEKLKDVVNKFSKEVEEEAEDIKEIPVEEEPVKKDKKKPEVKKEIPKETPKKEKPVKEEPEEKVKKSLKEEKPIDSKKEVKEIPVTKKEPEEVENKLEEISQKEIEPISKKEELVEEEIKEEPEEKEEVIEEHKEEVQEQPQEKTVKESKDEEEIIIEEIEDEPEEKKPGFFGKLFGKKKDKPIEPHPKEEPKEEKEEVVEKKLVESKKEFPIEEPQEAIEEVKEDVVEKKQIKEEPIKKEQVVEEIKQEKKGFFGKVSDTFTKIHLSDEKFNDLFWDIELALLENNMAVEVIEKIKNDLKEELTSEKISRKNTQEIILDTLKKSLEEVLDIDTIDLEAQIKKKKPFIIAVIGVNGSGKTTAIAKLANMYKQKGYSIVLAAADTFRAAAIQQLEEHATKLDIKLIKHDYNSDPAAVAFDAVRHAESKGIDIVMIDTAGRLHSNDNLMNELKKLIKVNKPDFKLFVGESITGNDCIEQAAKYNELIGIDGILLTKADIDEKGGAPISISYVTKKPVLFIGTGQRYEDIKPFNKKDILDNIGL